jgi:hypothetical protein
MKAIIDRKILSSLFTGLIFTHTSMVAIAADQGKYQAYGSRKVTESDPIKNYKKLETAPIDFPDLPVFPGKTKFVGGSYLPNTNGVSVCQMNYTCEDNSKAVMDFYKETFSGNGWKILFAGGPSITARHKNGHMCTVSVTESKLPKIKSQFMIAYRQIVK